MDIPDMTEERAGELIMTARAPWFAEAEVVIWHGKVNRTTTGYQGEY